jgi:predicted nuclease of predicted toxin-antitoxin system
VPSFLLDENVRAELDRFLTEREFVVRRLSKGAPDRMLSAVSRDERLVLVTNDADFATLRADAVHAVVLLRVPQRDAAGLLRAFRRLLTTDRRWEGRLFVLTAAKNRSLPLPQARVRPGTAG